MSAKTSPEAPLPIRSVLQMVAQWIGKLGTVWVEGQITELTARGGTVFLTLRDPVANVSARITCARAVYEASVPRPVDGARVVMHVKPDFWVNKGSFAFTALEIRPVGIGELLARLERLRQVLAGEGLFNVDRKRRLPFLPGTVGLICGRDSAAERDVLENSRRRWPAVRFKVEQVAVQGSYAVGEVTEALRKLDADREVDVIIIARGGGSLEDLLPFSDESLVRAVAACRTPVVSAIGHEQDSPLLDLVADVRASTPTDAAKKVVPDVGEQLTLVHQLRDRGRRVLRGWSSARSPGSTPYAPGRRSPIPSGSSTGGPSRSTRCASGPGAAFPRPWTARPTRWNISGPGSWPSPRQRRWSGVTPSRSVPPERSSAWPGTSSRVTSSRSASPTTA